MPRLKQTARPVFVATLTGHHRRGRAGARERIDHHVYVDALVPEHDQKPLQIMTATTADTFRRMAAGGGGWRIAATTRLVDKWGLEEGSPARRFVEAR
jgi:hypothetical protein